MTLSHFSDWILVRAYDWEMYAVRVDHGLASSEEVLYCCLMPAFIYGCALDVTGMQYPHIATNFEVAVLATGTGHSRDSMATEHDR